MLLFKILIVLRFFVRVYFVPNWFIIKLDLAVIYIDFPCLLVNEIKVGIFIGFKTLIQQKY